MLVNTLQGFCHVNLISGREWGCYSSSGQRKKGLLQKHSLAFPIHQGKRAPYTFTLAAHGPGAGAELFTGNDSLQGSNLVPLAYKTRYQILCAEMED